MFRRRTRPLSPYRCGWEREMRPVTDRRVAGVRVDRGAPLGIGDAHALPRTATNGIAVCGATLRIVGDEPWPPADDDVCARCAALVSAG